MVSLEVVFFIQGYLLTPDHVPEGGKVGLQGCKIKTMLSSCFTTPCNPMGIQNNSECKESFGHCWILLKTE